MKNLKLLLSLSAIISCSLFNSFSAFALLTPIVDSIPMSDGRKLAADVYIPSGITSGPVLLVQTPYNRTLYRNGLPLEIGTNVNSSNYIFVIVDWRGFYGSAAAAYSGSPSQGADGHSCVEWIAQQTWSNGKVGTWGPSALGRVQFETAETNPPHLVCICPLVAAPQYDYIEYFPNGCLRTEYVEQLNTLGFGIGPAIMPHPVHDNTWTYVENLNDYPDSIRVPCFMIGGWYDHTIEFMLPFFNELRTSSPSAVRNEHRLLMGPWVHGGHGIAQVGSATQGQLSYPNAVNWDDSLALRFFDYHLRNIANNWNTTPYVTYYQMGENVWENSPTWQPSGTTSTDFYFHHNKTMDNTLPTNNSDTLSFNYDPQNPSPTIGGPTLRSDLEQGPYDQRDSVESRNDILIFTTNTLTQNAVMKGNAVVHLKVSSNRKDTDFDIRLTDVYPDGRSMLVNDGVMRMRFRNGITAADTSAITPNTVYDCSITLPNTSITFLAGHKIRVDVTSSNYPRFNRNMNTDGTMYPGNNMDILVNPLVATNSVYVNNVNTSFVTLPLVGFTMGINDLNEDNRIKVYPNPARETVTIEVQSLKVESIKIINLLGETVYQSKTNSSSTSIDISHFAKGVYTVCVISENGNVFKKLVIQ